MDTILYFQSPSQTSAHDKIAGVRRFAAVRDWHVQVVKGLLPPKTMLHLIDFWLPRGIIVECGGGYNDIPSSLYSELPIVYLDRDPRTLPVDASCVSHDSVATGRLAAKELLRTGHQSFAFVPYPQPRFWSDDRERGFREALKLNGKTCETFDCGCHDPQSVTWHRVLRKWIVRLPKPCGIFAANDSIAAEVLTAAVQSGIDIPREIAVCGVDNFTPICEYTLPTLTSIQPDFLLAGELAARTLDELADGRYAKSIHLTFGPASLVRRASSCTGRRYDAEVAVALEQIRRQACNGISAADVTATFACSRRMAEIRFRGVTGHSVLDEIQAVRLERAKELLSNSRQDLSAIANFCGFKTANSFWKFFRQETGQSPSQWRKKNKKGHG